MNQVSERDKSLIKGRLGQALDVGRLLKLQSDDWQNLVDIYTQKTEGERIIPRYQRDEKGAITGIYYVLPDREVTAGGDGHELADDKSLESAIVHLAEQSKQKELDGIGFNRDDYKWGMDLANQIKQGQPISVEQAQSALTRVGKYKGQLSKANISLPVWEEIAYQYDPTAKREVVVKGSELGEPFDKPTNLKKAVSQAVEPEKANKLLMKLGDFLATAAQHFRSRNDGLDGFDMIQTGASLAGAGLMIAGGIGEFIRFLKAKEYHPDSPLPGYINDLESISSEMEQTLVDSDLVLTARGETPPKLTLQSNDRYSVAEAAERLLDYQSRTLQALDPERMPKPISVSSSNESIKDAIALLKTRSAELKALTLEVKDTEQPLEATKGAIKAQDLWNHVGNFFKAREEANNRSFNRNLYYSLSNQGGQTVEWNKNGLRVIEGNNTTLEIKRTEDQLTVIKTDPKIVTGLKNLPVKKEVIQRKVLEASVLDGLKKLPQYSKGGTLAVGDVCVFDFKPSDKECFITGTSKKDQNLLWQSGPKVELNKLDLNILAKLASRLHRATVAQTTVKPVLSPKKTQQLSLST